MGKKKIPENIGEYLGSYGLTLADLKKKYTEPQKIELGKLAKKGDRSSFKKLMGIHFHTIVGTANTLVKDSTNHLRRSDLIQEGIIGLMKGIEKFNYRKPRGWSSYISFWVLQAMQRAVADQEKLIRLPVHLEERLKKVVMTVAALEEEASKVSNEQERDKLKLQIREVRRQLDSIPQAFYKKRLHDLKLEETSLLPIDSVMSINLQEQTRNILTTLTPREEKVLRMRFGIGKKSDKTLEEVGRDFSVTRERIRQIEAKALRKLQHLSRNRILKKIVS